MSTHDPKQVIEDLRNHLALHDKRIAFLFGAGTSSSVNVESPPSTGGKLKHTPLIPGIEGLTELCATAVRALGETQDDAWNKLVEQCEQENVPANVERILSKVRMKIDAIGEGEILLGLDQEQLREIERTICATIAKSAFPDESIIPQQVPHNNFTAWVKKVNRTSPIEIFTTNYDILFERAFEASRIPLFDGFVGTHNAFFFPDCIDDENLLPSSKWVRIWKLHGSVNWHLESVAGVKRIVRTRPSLEGEMILPSHRKYDESRKQPYIAYIDRLSRILNSEHAILITCGYSFGDEHINAILYGALDNCRTVNIFALNYQDLEEDDNVVVEATRRLKLTVIGPNGGTISGEWGLWQLTQPIDKKTHSFMDTAFDSNAAPEDEGSPAAVSTDLKGKMRLGDFNWFCRFLNEMGPNYQ